MRLGRAGALPAPWPAPCPAYAVAVVLLAASLLTACSDEQDSYCDALEGAEQELTDLADRPALRATARRVDTLTPTLDILPTACARQAPDELGGRVGHARVRLRGARRGGRAKRASTRPSCEAGDGAGDLPPGQRRELRAVASKLLLGSRARASQGIEDHARRSARSTSTRRRGATGTDPALRRQTVTRFRPFLSRPAIEVPTVALPPLTPEQRQANLDKAAASRRERAEVKNRLKHSGGSILEVLEQGQPTR